MIIGMHSKAREYITQIFAHQINILILILNT